MANNDNILFVREYLKALEDGEAGESLERFFTEDARQIELPNKLNPAGGESDLATMKKRSEEGKKEATQKTKLYHQIQNC